MPQVVVDANIVVKLVLFEEGYETIRQLWIEWADTAIERVAPAL